MAQKLGPLLDNDRRIIHLRMKRGHTMLVPLASQLAWEPAFTGRYDEGEIDLLLEILVHDSYLLDVGASFGFYTVPIALEGHERGIHVVAIEPLQVNRDILKLNVDRNGIDERVTVLGVALGAENRTAVALAWPEKRQGPIPPGNAAVAWREMDNPGMILIEITPLDGLVMPQPVAQMRCSVMKLDVEGYELEVLAGASRFIKRHRPVIFGEFGLAWFERRNVRPDAVERWAEANGYSAYQVEAHRQNSFLAPTSIRIEALSDIRSRTSDSVLLIPLELESESDGRRPEGAGTSTLKAKDTSSGTYSRRSAGRRRDTR